MRATAALLLGLSALSGCSGACLSEGRQPDICLSGVLYSECTDWSQEGFQGATWTFLPGCPFDYNVLCDSQTFAKTTQDCVR